MQYLSSFPTRQLAALAATALADYADPVYSKEGIATVRLEVPGYKRGEISVEVADDTVTVTAENAVRGKRSWQRYVPSVDAARITAKLEDGLLTLSLPCLADALPRKVEVT